MRRAKEHEDGLHEVKEQTRIQARWQIIIADVSMSLDNMLAVAAVARNNVPMLAPKPH